MAYWKIAGETGDYEGGRLWHITVGEHWVEWQLPEHWAVTAGACAGWAQPCPAQSSVLGPALHSLSLALCCSPGIQRAHSGARGSQGGCAAQNNRHTKPHTSFFSPFCREQQSFLCPLSSIIYYQGPEVVWMLLSSWVPSQMTHWIRWLRVKCSWRFLWPLIRGKQQLRITKCL